MPTEFFTADEHYWHTNIIRYCERGHENIKKMHKDLITKHNEVVTEKDIVWHLGDFSMLGRDKANHIEKIFSQLKGTHHLVLGNHDELKPFRYIKMGFASVHTSMWFEREGRTFVLAHDPSVYTVVENLGQNTYMLCGHIHRLFKHLLPHKRIINIGVDVWEFRPVALNQILKLIETAGDNQ